MTDPAADASYPSEPLTSAPPSPLVTHRGMWFGLLAVYMSLFLLIGYLAFFQPSPNPGHQSYTQLESIQDPETRAFFIDSLKMENAEHSKQRNLATQSFNVVLGALLGFLSSSATFYLRQQQKTDGPPTEANP